MSEWKPIETMPMDRNVIVGTTEDPDRLAFAFKTIFRQDPGNAHIVIIGGNWTPTHWREPPVPPSDLVLP